MKKKYPKQQTVWLKAQMKKLHFNSREIIACIGWKTQNRAETYQKGGKEGKEEEKEEGKEERKEGRM